MAELRVNLGTALREQGRLNEAMEQYRAALEIQDDPVAHNCLGKILASQGHLDEAIVHYQVVLKTVPDSAKVHFNLGTAYFQQGKTGKALAEWREVIRLDPDAIAVLNVTAWLLATSADRSVRNGAEAVELAERAVKLSDGNDPAVLDTLAAAYAEAGRFPEAIQTERRALALASSRTNTTLAEKINARIKLYKVGTSYHDAR
jgi:spermidine synthase